LKPLAPIRMYFKIPVGNGENVAIKGAWNRQVFKNDHPIVVELACGKGEYTLALAQQFPKYNYIGIDLKGNRIWKGAKKAY